MARFATYILDSDLESLAIRAITEVGGELALRAVSLPQLQLLEPEVILISNLKVESRNTILLVDRQMVLHELVLLLSEEHQSQQRILLKGSRRVISLLGLSGGVGTTTLATNLAFELSLKERVALLDLDAKYPEIAKNLGLHRIEGRNEKVGPNLQVIQGLTSFADCESFVIDLGSNPNEQLMGQLLGQSDLIYVVCRLNANTLSRLQGLPIGAFTLICNFYEKSKAQINWLRQIQSEFPRVVLIPYEPKSFEITAERRSALLEEFPNSHARKAIATLGRCESI